MHIDQAQHRRRRKMAEKERGQVWGGDLCLHARARGFQSRTCDRRPAPRATQPGLSGTRTGREEQVPLERPHHRRKRQLQRKVATTIPFPSWVRLLRQRNSAVSSPALPVRTRWGSLVRFKGSGLAWGRAAFRSDVLPPDTEEEAGRQRFFLDYTEQDKDCLGSGDLQEGMG